jgi:murein DD-endopeptidase MepM/ murein hydrolase activator NlpD
VTRRAAAAVLGVALTAVALMTPVPGAGALEAIDDVAATTTSTVDDDLLGAVIGETTTSIVDEVVAVVTGETSTTTTTTSTTAPTTTSTSSTTSSTTTTTTTRLDPRPATTTPTSTAPAPDVVVADAPAVAVVAPVPVPALLHEPPRSLMTPPGPRSTLGVLELLQQRVAPQLVARVLAPFPVAGPAHYTDDWGAPRHGPPAHAHQGTDIFAARGTPVIAALDGTVDRMSTTSRLGGTSLRVTLESGTFFYYAHLDGFAPGMTEGRRVRAGDVVGFVGNTGNAAGTPPHLHFEIHPRGGRAVSPVPYLDRWVAEATATARAITGARAINAVAPALVVPAEAEERSLTATPRAASLTMTPLRTQPVSAIDPTPMFALAGVLIAFSWLAQRGKRRARALRRDTRTAGRRATGGSR